MPMRETLLRMSNTVLKRQIQYYSYNTGKPSNKKYNKIHQYNVTNLNCNLFPSRIVLTKLKQTIHTSTGHSGIDINSRSFSNEISKVLM